MKRENKRYINFVRKEVQNELDIFQSFFSTPIFEKKVVYKDGDKIYICFRDNENFLKKFIHIHFTHLIKSGFQLV